MQDLASVSTEKITIPGMKTYTNIIFDLDGTLTDPALGITNSVIYALEKYGIPVPDRSELLKFIGPPLIESFQEFYGLSRDEAKIAVDYYREYYREKGIIENSVFPGIEDLLKSLKENGKTLMVATAKVEQFAETVLEHFGIAKYFTCIAGSDLANTITYKGEIILSVLGRCSITDLEHTVMIGDRMHDMLGAKYASIDSIGVLFGYGTKEELENAGADIIATSVDDLKTILSPQV
ncbi:MAG: HAD family hydrolase [Methanocorpusculum sp.]|uniref:HAD family hydrolase n=1 Tax=Methanocorpusculum sp. TaxID=2058474 RepID=UPI00271E2005|nr:HAD family hydrolase [Methanocorpusculum sp.]MDO9522277.1 HAD family hydrolase [Methanocorpusculum sp.]